MPATRRLAALMFTDLAGFTASAQADERGALRMLERHNRVLRSMFRKHRGREVKTIGDAFLVEFGSALDAVECATAVQKKLREEGLRAPGPHPIAVRIGIHLGDVVGQGTDILGDAVNVASRIAPLAEPGGICLSEQVFDQVRNKIPLRLEKLPPRQLKHVRFAVDVYRVVLPWERTAGAPEERPRHRVAVLPFRNISPDPADDYIADGLTEELISVLSRVPPLRVIARTSVLPYKLAQKPIPQIGSELAVGSVLEGSVRKVGGRLRITAQLVDVVSQEAVWTAAFDRELTDVFALQSEIAREVAGALRVTVREGGDGPLPVRTAVNPESYLAYLRGRTRLHERSSSALAAARREFELAVHLDDRNAAAYAGLADVTLLKGLYSHAPPRFTESHAFAARAVELAPELAEPHTSFANILLREYSYVRAEEEFRRALALNPGYATAHHWYAILLQDRAKAEEGMRELSLAEEADPLSPVILSAEIQLLTWLERHDEAEVRLDRLAKVDAAGTTLHANRAMLAFARSDRRAARAELSLLRKLDPDDPSLLADYASYSAWTGDRSRARDLLRRFEAGSARIPFREDKIAAVYAEIGDLDACFRWLEKGLRRHALEIRVWRLDPWYETVRRDPRFATLLRGMNLE